MLPSDMLEIRNAVEMALNQAGFSRGGGGVSLTQPEADLEMTFQGKRLLIHIEARDESYNVISPDTVRQNPTSSDDANDPNRPHTA